MILAALSTALRFAKPAARSKLSGISLPKAPRTPRTLASVFRHQNASARLLHTSKRSLCDSKASQAASTAADTITKDHMAPSTDGVFTLGNVNEEDSMSRMLTLVFTCNVCETRAARQFSHHSYTKGAVIIQCPGCDKYHLIADHLGWFNEGKNIEEFMAKKGETVRKITDASEITPEIQAYVDEAAADRAASVTRRTDMLRKRASDKVEQAKTQEEMRDLIQTLGSRQ